MSFEDLYEAVLSGDKNAAVTPDYSDAIKADACADNATAAVRAAQELIGG